MDAWFCIEQELSPRGTNREPKNLKKLFTRSSEARRESFFLLTRTYHGCPVAQPVKCTFQILSTRDGQLFRHPLKFLHGGARCPTTRPSSKSIATITTI